MPHPPLVPVIVGPTGSGKSVVGMAVARRLGGEIVSADSRQIYKYLDIGTAKPTAKERAEIPHHFVDELMPDQDFNAGIFGEGGRGAIDAILARGKTPVVVGGTGLYIQSLIDGFFEGPGADKGFREAMQNRIDAGEIHALIAELEKADPAAAAKADPTKPRRIVRALEVYHLTGRSLSEHHRQARLTLKFAPVMAALRWKRAVLYARIEKRCERMLSEGLLSEVERLEGMGYTPSMNALNTVGYVEAFAYRRGEIGFEEMVRLIKQNTRRYAKRQLTWFRRDPRIRWYDVESDADLRGAADWLAGLLR